MHSPKVDFLVTLKKGGIVKFVSKFFLLIGLVFVSTNVLDAMKIKQITFQNPTSNNTEKTSSSRSASSQKTPVQSAMDSKDSAMMVVSTDQFTQNASTMNKKEYNRKDIELIIKGAGDGNVELLELAINNNININYSGSEIFQTTALIEAAKHGKSNCVKILLAHDAEINQEDCHGKTALMHAVARGHVEIVQMLIEAQAAINIVKDSLLHECESALTVAASHGQDKCVEILLANKAEADYQTLFKHTALMLAAKQGHCKVVARLIAAHAGINLLDWLGKSALMLAVEHGHIETVKILLSVPGIDLTPKDFSDDKTAREIATDKGYTEIVDMLKQAELQKNSAMLP
jgi:ankyrin repeat protein